MEILETIGYVIVVAIAFGVIATVAFIAAVFIMQGPDEEDKDIKENEFWNKKSKS